jgi:hypothetical protein
MPRKDPKCKQSDNCKYKTQGHCITGDLQLLVNLLTAFIKDFLINFQKKKMVSVQYQLK